MGKRSGGKGSGGKGGKSSGGKGSGGWPSTTPKPSGPGRNNNPPKGK
jgi:hypothetical protein